MDIAWEDKPANHATVRRVVEDLDPAPGDLLVLPEMFDVGFSLNVDRTADEVTDGSSERFAAELARARGIFVQGASARRPEPDGKATNNAVVFDPEGTLVCRYEKVHPFSGGREPEAFRAGTTIDTFRWNDLVVCPLICYDLRFPELFRLAVLEHGAEMFTIGASWPAPRQWHWSILLDARAIENQACVVGVNRCREDPHLPYAGGTKIVDPMGRVVAETSENAPAVVSASIDPAQVRDWRAKFVALDDVHRDLLGTIPRRR